jgi:hypothetical protein
MTSKSNIIKRNVLRDSRGMKTKQTVVHELQSRRATYNYEVEYGPDATEAHFAKDARLLEVMADEQADKLDEYAAVYGATVSAAGLTAVIVDCAAHIDGPGRCRLFLRFTVLEKSMPASKTFEVGTPRQFPTVQQITDYIRAYLTDLAND